MPHGTETLALALLHVLLRVLLIPRFRHEQLLLQLVPVRSQTADTFPKLAKVSA